MSDSAQRTPHITSRFHSGQFCITSQHHVSFMYRYLFLHTSGSFGSSLGCGTNITPFLLFFNFDRSLPRARDATGSRSSSVDVPTVHRKGSISLSYPSLWDCTAKNDRGARLTRHVGHLVVFQHSQTHLVVYSQHVYVKGEEKYRRHNTCGRRRPHFLYHDSARANPRRTSHPTAASQPATVADLE